MIILLLEPDKILADVYKKYLQDQGNEVVHVLTAGSAVEALNDTRPEVILCELQLAGHNGIEFLYEIRSYADLRSIPAVVLSQVHPSKLAGNTKQIKLLGIKQYLYKPSAKLLDIKEALESARL